MGCTAPGGVYTTGPELSLDLSTLQWLVLVLDSIREIGCSIPLSIYFEILQSGCKKRSTLAEPVLKKGLRRLSVRKKLPTQTEPALKICLCRLSLH